MSYIYIILKKKTIARIHLIKSYVDKLDGRMNDSRMFYRKCLKKREKNQRQYPPRKLVFDVCVQYMFRFIFVFLSLIHI